VHGKVVSRASGDGNSVGGPVGLEAHNVTSIRLWRMIKQLGQTSSRFTGRPCRDRYKENPVHKGPGVYD
jgi:hypothetical protein